MFVLRTRDDASRLRERLAAQPKRVLIIGAGFTGSEIASACRELGLAVTVAERGPFPLVGALGGVIGAIAARIQRQNGVDYWASASINSWALLPLNQKSRSSKAACKKSSRPPLVCRRAANRKKSLSLS
jgi:cation diffusion facilitator CzcD-associated flavoprotein CzcO